MTPVRARPTGPMAPSIHLRAVFTWLAVYGMIMVTQALLAPVLGPLSLPVRTFMVTVIVVPTVVYALVPATLRATRPCGPTRHCGTRAPGRRRDQRTAFAVTTQQAPALREASGPTRIGDLQRLRVARSPPYAARPADDTDP